MMMASCIGQWTCTLGEIFRKSTECCSKRIMAADRLFYRMVRDKYSFVVHVYDGQFTHFQVFRNSDTTYVDLWSDAICC